MRTLAAAKHLYVGSVRGVRRTVRHLGGDRQAPTPERRWRHWAQSLGAVHDSDELIRLDVPWWTYRAIAEVQDWLSARPGPTTVLEYGSGASTVWLSRRAAQVHSIEHDAAFARDLGPTLAQHANIDVRVVPPVARPHPVVPSGKEGCAGLDFEAYVRAIDDVPGRFDLVVIDGRAREACLEAALARVADDGLVVFDNSARRRYRPAIRRSGLEEQALRGLTPSLPYPEQTSLLRRR